MKSLGQKICDIIRSRDDEREAADVILSVISQTVALDIEALHVMEPVYLTEDQCLDHDENHRSFEVSVGEYVCTSTPPEYYICSHCSQDSMEEVGWPCPTMQILDSYGL